MKKNKFSKFMIGSWLALTFVLSTDLLAKTVDYSDFACPFLAPGATWEKVPHKGLYRLAWPEQLMDGFPASHLDGSVNAVIEIPAGCMDKWETDRKGKMYWDIDGVRPRYYQFLPLPGNYGMIPRTLMDPEEGGDGDPLDIMVLGPMMARGSVVRARIIGVIVANDDGETDDKLIAVPYDPSPSNIYSKVKNMEELPYGVKEIILQWFMHYKGRSQVIINQVLGPKKAEELIKKASMSYLARHPSLPKPAASAAVPGSGDKAKADKKQDKKKSKKKDPQD